MDFMREISVNKIRDSVRDLCISANYYIGSDVKDSLINYRNRENYPIAKEVLGKIVENADISKNENMPMCQDTGMVCVFLDVGQDVHFIDGVIEEAINEGVRRGYEEGYLRKSVVKDPIDRVNTKDNTPAVIYYNLVKGDKVKVTVSPKGFGSENMSKIAMLKPSDGLEGIKGFILKTVEEAGPNPCPPMIVGVGIGGTFDKAAYLSKKALLRPINEENKNEFYAQLEKDLLKDINSLGIGPQGFGGLTTALGVNIEVYPTHIAGLPVAVNISCHATRHKEAVI